MTFLLWLDLSTKLQWLFSCDWIYQQNYNDFSLVTGFINKITMTFLLWLDLSTKLQWLFSCDWIYQQTYNDFSLVTGFINKITMTLYTGKNTKITLALFLLKFCHFFHISTPYQNSVLIKKPSCSWWYGSWIYNYLFNQCLSPLTLWVWTPFMGRCTWYNIMW